MWSSRARAERVRDGDDLGRCRGGRVVGELDGVGQGLARWNEALGAIAGGADDVVGVTVGNIRTTSRCCPVAAAHAAGSLVGLEHQGVGRHGFLWRHGHITVGELRQFWLVRPRVLGAVDLLFLELGDLIVQIIKLAHRLGEFGLQVRLIGRGVCNQGCRVWMSFCKTWVIARLYGVVLDAPGSPRLFASFRFGFYQVFPGVETPVRPS